MNRLQKELFALYSPNSVPLGESRSFQRAVVTGFIDLVEDREEAAEEAEAKKKLKNGKQTKKKKKDRKVVR